MTSDTLDCGHVLTAPDGIGTGYARDGSTDATMCYPCAEESEREAFSSADVFVAYVDSLGNLTTWTGARLASFMPHTGGVSRSGWHGSHIYSWRFRADDGSEWYGRNAGPGMVIRVRRAKSDAR